MSRIDKPSIASSENRQPSTSEQDDKNEHPEGIFNHSQNIPPRLLFFVLIATLEFYFGPSRFRAFFIPTSTPLLQVKRK